MGMQKSFRRRSKIDRAILDGATAIELIGQLARRLFDLEARFNKQFPPVERQPEEPKVEETKTEV